MKKRAGKPRSKVKAVASPRIAEGVQYTVRNVPANVDMALRRKATEQKQSLNEVLRHALLKEAGQAGEERHVYHDLDHLAGTWVDDPEFDAAIRDQDVIDESLWK